MELCDLARLTASIAAQSIDGQSPRHADEPRAEFFAMAKLVKRSVRPDERFLRDVFSVLPVADDAVRDAEGQSGRLDEPGFELLFDLPVHVGYAGQPANQFMHAVSPQPDAAAGRRVH